MALRGILKATVYVKVRANEFFVRHIESGRQSHARSPVPFSTRRLLVGDFIVAERCLSEALREVRYGPAYFAAPVVVIHPLEMTEGGLSPVESRVFLELAHGAGGKSAVVWVGGELADSEVLEKSRAA